NACHLSKVGNERSFLNQLKGLRPEKRIGQQQKKRLESPFSQTETDATSTSKKRHYAEVFDICMT
ncbi:MAG: hypothetical protein QNJ03_12205, partial [Dinoroseobacter sp.]|nr:hypothetical protein [Dinoroseobacter sp.]